MFVGFRAGITSKEAHTDILFSVSGMFVSLPKPASGRVQQRADIPDNTLGCEPLPWLARGWCSMRGFLLRRYTGDNALASRRLGSDERLTTAKVYRRRSLSEPKARFR